MEPQATPEFLIGQMRVLTMSEETFFYVANKPTVFADLDKDLDILLSKLEAAQARIDRLVAAGDGGTELAPFEGEPGEK